MVTLGAFSAGRPLPLDRFRSGEYDGANASSPSQDKAVLRGQGIGAAMPPRNVSILLVDDSEDDFLMTKIKLAQVAGWECKVGWVSSYQAAVEAIRRAEH